MVNQQKFTVKFERIKNLKIEDWEKDIDAQK
jgi:hypothetical protein